MAITRRTVVRVETSRKTTNSRRAAVTLCVKAEVAPEIQMAKRLERIEKRKRMRKARELAGQRLLLKLPLGERLPGSPTASATA
jgi:hypothetical protein